MVCDHQIWAELSASIFDNTLFGNNVLFRFDDSGEVLTNDSEILTFVAFEGVVVEAVGLWSTASIIPREVTETLRLQPFRNQDELMQTTREISDIEFDDDGENFVVAMLKMSESSSEFPGETFFGVCDVDSFNDALNSGIAIEGGVEGFLSDCPRYVGILDSEDAGTGNIDASITANVNTWGSGFNTTYAYEITESDTAGGLLDEWQIEIDAASPLSITSAWINNGYNAGISTGTESGQFVITNEDQGFIRQLSAGDIITFTIQGSGGGFDANSLTINFESLSQTPDAGEEPPVSESLLPPNASFANVNDWGSGFNVAIEYELTADDISGANNDPWTFTLDYSGAGTVTSSWVNGIGGSISRDIVGGSQVIYANDANGYRANVGVGDVINFNVGVSGSSFNEGDFLVTFTQ